tara:strand:- start:7343 stop:7801 length:459 start_codon:yes stop_codon:yes gene_type:complete
MQLRAIRATILSFVLLGLMGCTISTPVTNVGSYEGLKNSDRSNATLYVYRESAAFGSVNQYDVMVNGELAGSLPNGSFFTVDVLPGETKVEPRTLTAFGFGNGSTVSVDKGKPYCFKLTLNFCLQCKSANIVAVNTPKCEAEIDSLRKVKLK